MKKAQDYFNEAEKLKEGKIKAAQSELKEVAQQLYQDLLSHLDNLKQEVTKLTDKVKQKLKGTGGEMREPVEELSREVKKLSEKVKDLIPSRRKQSQLPVRVDKYPEFRSDTWERPYLELRRATDRLFDDFFRSSGWPIAQARSPWGPTTHMSGTEWPRIDINETDEEVRITAELPGVDKDNIDNSVTKNRITI